MYIQLCYGLLLGDTKRRSKGDLLLIHRIKGKYKTAHTEICHPYIVIQDENIRKYMQNSLLIC